MEPVFRVGSCWSASSVLSQVMCSPSVHARRVKSAGANAQNSYGFRHLSCARLTRYVRSERVAQNRLGVPPEGAGPTWRYRTMSPDPQDRVAVAGSERPPVAEARSAGDVDPGREIDVTVTVRPRGDQELDELGGRLEEADGATPELSREELAERHGADPADLERVGKVAQDHGLGGVESSQPRRTIVLRGTIADMSKAFGVDLQLYEHPELGVYRGRTGPVYIPSELEGVIDGVFGLDDRPVARPRLRRLDDVGGKIEPHVARAYAPNEVPGP